MECHCIIVIKHGLLCFVTLMHGWACIDEGPSSWPQALTFTKHRQRMFNYYSELKLRRKEDLYQMSYHNAIMHMLDGLVTSLPQ